MSVYTYKRHFQLQGLEGRNDFRAPSLVTKNIWRDTGKGILLEGKHRSGDVCLDRQCSKVHWCCCKIP